MLTVELFAGIGGFRIAADELGFKTIWANEIEKKAVSVYRSRFGSDELKDGDIWHHKKDVPDHDLLTGGFPCQPFSSAGKKQGIEDPRGTLFQAICEILVARRPRFFLLENVKRLLSMDSGRHFATILDALCSAGYTLEWRLLNSQDFGLPQNRQRIVIGGRLNHDQNVVSRFANRIDFNSISGKQIESICDRLEWKSLAKCDKPFPTWGLCRDGYWNGSALGRTHTGIKTPTFESLLEQNVPESYFMTESTLTRIIESDHVNKFYDGVEILYNQSGGARMGYTVYGVNGVAPALTCTASRHYERYLIGGEYRRLTPNEYARLQGFPDNHCDAVSPYNQYALYGNAAPPPLLKWALDRLLNDDFLPMDTLSHTHARTLAL
jgi:DNA (cytosine-5)-methyltransferase 1